MTTPLPQFATSADYPVTSNEIYLDAAADIIRGFCRWHVWPVRTETITVDGPGTRSLFLPTMRLLAVTDVTEVDAADTMQPVSITRRWWSQAGWIRKPPGEFWTEQPGGITLTITHGYDMMPPALRGLAVDLALRSAAKGVIRSTVGAVTEMYAQGQLTAADMPQLEPYRRAV